MIKSNYDDQSLKIIKNLDQLSLDKGLVGSEHLLLELVRVENSILLRLLKEYGLTLPLLEERIENLTILRINKTENNYTTKLEEILNRANQIKKSSGTKLIYPEHLIYALLITEDSIARSLLEHFDIDVEDLLDEVNSIYDIDLDSEISNNALSNITKEAKQNTLNPFIGKSELIDKILRILSKRNKNNPMLIGSAGVGKTALVEAVAIKLLEVNPSINLYRLDLGLIIAGTKYRGDLEERLINVIERIKNPYSIVFIDEIHNIIQSGSSEGSLDIANILKPILARSEIKCIGATTLDEYYKFIEKDKALSRRFQNVFVDEASFEEACSILKGIKHIYEDYHKVQYSDDIINYIVDASNFIATRKLPDKAIDILDEVGLIANGAVLKSDVDKIVFENLGIDYKKAVSRIEKVEYYKELAKYYKQYFINLDFRKTILNLQTKEVNIDYIINDLKYIFGIKDEAILKVDLSNYSGFNYSSLIGSPSGYVGFDQGGVLTEHVIKFNLSILIFKNYSLVDKRLSSLIETIISEGNINDSKNRSVSFRNSILIFIEDNQTTELGFLKNSRSIKKLAPFIDEVLVDIQSSCYYRKKLDRSLKKLKDENFQFELRIDQIDYSIYKQIINELSKFNFEEDLMYEIKYQNSTVIIDLINEEEKVISRIKNN